MSFQILSSRSHSNISRGLAGITKAKTMKKYTSQASNISISKWGWRKKKNWRTPLSNWDSEKTEITMVRWFLKTTFLSRRIWTIKKLRGSSADSIQTNISMEKKMFTQDILKNETSLIHIDFVYSILNLDCYIWVYSSVGFRNGYRWTV